MRQTIRYGHGYENPTLPGFQPCKAFDGFDVIANPLGGFSERDRERRVFPRHEAQIKVTYGSHSVSLGREQPAEGRVRDREGRRSLAVMMHHGGGRQLSPLRICQCADKVEAGLLAMDEDALYFLLYAISETVDDARRQGVEQERERWTKAAEEGRLRKRKGRLTVFDYWEMPRAWRDAHPIRQSEEA